MGAQQKFALAGAPMPAREARALPRLRDADEMTGSDKPAPKSVMGRLVALIVIVIALFLAMKFLPVQQWLGSFNDWVGQMGAVGIFIFIGVYAVASAARARSDPHHRCRIRLRFMERFSCRLRWLDSRCCTRLSRCPLHRPRQS